MWKAIRAALRALGRVVTRTVRLASGVVLTFVEMLWPSPPPLDYADDEVAEAAELDREALERDPARESYETVGSMVRQAASERVTHGQVVDTRIPVAIRNYVNALPRTSLAVILTSTPYDVGRHVAGVAILNDEIGLAIRTPEVEADARRVEHRRVETERREAAYRKPSRRPRTPALVVPVPVPGL